MLQSSFRFEGLVLKIIIAAVGIFALVSCVAQESEPQAGSQHASSGVEPAVSSDGDQIVGQTIYVPIYSHIYTGSKSRTINLGATLSIRNTDAKNSIRLSSARYYGTNGQLLKEYVPTALRLGPMASTDFVVDINDTTGGAGANFIVEWSASIEVTPPVVEAVMINTTSQQGISFISTGRVIKDRPASLGVRSP
jgi:hypothetical protein